MPKETRRKRRRKQMLGSVEHNEWCQKEQFEKKLSKKNDAKGDTLLTHLVVKRAKDTLKLKTHFSPLGNKSLLSSHFCDE